MLKLMTEGLVLTYKGAVGWGEVGVRVRVRVKFGWCLDGQAVHAQRAHDEHVAVVAVALGRRRAEEACAGYGRARRGTRVRGAEGACEACVVEEHLGACGHAGAPLVAGVERQRQHVRRDVVHGPVPEATHGGRVRVVAGDHERLGAGGRTLVRRLGLGSGSGIAKARVRVRVRARARSACCAPSKRDAARCPRRLASRRRLSAAAQPRWRLDDQSKWDQ
eukprot:scaffold28267_cov57-Phaeocystis_antarctica.AAC.3